MNIFKNYMFPISSEEYKDYFKKQNQHSQKGKFQNIGDQSIKLVLIIKSQHDQTHNNA